MIVKKLWEMPAKSKTELVKRKSKRDYSKFYLKKPDNG